MLSSTRSLVATPYRRGVLVLAVVTLVWRAWTVSRWSWQDDDWIYMDGTRTMGLWSYLWQNYNGHLMPAEFLLNWVVTKVAPLDFAVPVSIVALSSAGLTLLWGHVLERIAGARTVVLAALAVVALSPLLLRPTLWWAAALQALPLQAFLALTVLLAFRAATDPRSGDAVRLAAVLACALLFWQKALLLTIVMAFVVLYAASGSLAERVRRAARTLWPSAVVAAAYLPLFAYLTRQDAGANQIEIDVTQVTAADALQFMARGVGEILVPALAGGPWGTLPVDSDVWVHQAVGPSVAFGVVGIALALVLVLRVRHGWMLLAMVVLYAATAWGLVLFSSRYLLVQQAAVTTERFNVDVLPVAVVAGLLGLSAPRRDGAPSRRWPLAGRHAGSVVVGALAVSLVVANVWQVSRIGVSGSRAWVDTVTGELDERGDVVLWDGNAPDHVMPAFWLEYSHLSHLLAVRHDVSFTGAGSPMYGVAPSGELVPVTVSPDSRAEPGPVPDCGWSIAPGTSVTLPMTAPLFEWRWGLQVDTYAAEGGPMTVTVGETTVEMDVAPGLTSTQATVSGPVDGEVTLSLAPDAGTLCVTSLVVGNVSLPPTSAG